MTNTKDKDRIVTILDSCRIDAAAQLEALQTLIATGNSCDIKAMAIMALAAENSAKTVQKLYQLSLTGGNHALA